MSDSELRALAETCLDATSKGWIIGELAEFHRAATPDVVLGLLDRLAAAERVVDAARAMANTWTAYRVSAAGDYYWETKDLFDSLSDRNDDLHTALAALDGEKGR